MRSLCTRDQSRELSVSPTPSVSTCVCEGPQSRPGLSPFSRPFPDLHLLSRRTPPLVTSTPKLPTYPQTFLRLQTSNRVGRYRTPYFSSFSLHRPPPWTLRSSISKSPTVRSNLGKDRNSQVRTNLRRLKTFSFLILQPSPSFGVWFLFILQILSFVNNSWMLVQEKCIVE